VAPDVRKPNVAIDVADFGINVQPGPIAVPASSITTNQPKIVGSVPPLQFNFPASRVEQAALTNLTAELVEYRRTLQTLASHDTRLDQQNQTIIRLERDNASLAAELAARPTREELVELTGKVAQHN